MDVYFSMQGTSVPACLGQRFFVPVSYRARHGARVFVCPFLHCMYSFCPLHAEAVTPRECVIIMWSTVGVVGQDLCHEWLYNQPKYTNFWKKLLTVRGIEIYSTRSRQAGEEHHSSIAEVSGHPIALALGLANNGWITSAKPRVRDIGRPVTFITLTSRYHHSRRYRPTVHPALAVV